MIEEAPWRERSRLVRAWRLARSRRPRTFTEKVRYKMLRDHRPLLVTFADKVAARDYIADAVGERYLPHLHAVVDEPEQLAALPLPRRCVIKPTHGSGAVIAVDPDAPAGAVLPDPAGDWVYSAVRPEALDRDRLVRLAAAWLRRRHGLGPNAEWAYGHVPPRVLVEELLHGPDGGIPHDHKFFVFHGRCQYVQVDTGRFDRHTQDFFTRDWDRVPMGGGLPWADPAPARPASLAEMIEVAERLGRETDFVRVDQYVADRDGRERVVVGELTSYPAGGHSPFVPDRFDAVFGGHWTVPRRYR